jgi:nickel-dependent lactate racemase
LPDGWPAQYYHMPGYKLPALKPEEIKTAIANLIGLAPIRELARGKKEVVIIFDDMTRVTRTAGVVPFVLEELALAGIPENKIRFICALGNHGASTRVDFAKKLGEDVVARFPVYNHNPFFNCSYVGTTSAGTKVHINDEVLKCDFKIAIGSVVPHPTTGFGGGGKIILPGVASIETAQAFHIVPFRARTEKWAKSAGGMGVFDNNPARQDADEAAVLAGLDVKVDCLVNMWGETTAIFAGAPGPAYAAAIGQAKAHYRTPRTRDENIVISNTFAKANEAILLGLDTAFNALNGRSGDVVLIANAPDGQVTHYLMGPFGKTTTGALRLQTGIPQNVNHVIIYSEYPDLTGRSYVEESERVLFMNDWSQVVPALREFHGDNAKVAVYPNAEIQYCAP